MPSKKTGKVTKERREKVRPYARRPSVRKLDEFESIFKHFEGLSMSAADNTKAMSSEANSVQGVLKGPDDLAKDINKLLGDRAKPLRMLETFSATSAVSRQCLAAVQNKVTLYTLVGDMDIRLDYLHSEWLDCCGKTTEELEDESNPLSPNKMVTHLDKSGEILDKVEEVFKNIKQKYPNKQVVIDHLDFVDSPLPKPGAGGDGSVVSGKSPSVTINLGKDEEYVKAKLPKLKAEVESRFATIKEKFEESEDISGHQLNHIHKQLENLETKLADDSPFEKLLKDAYSFPDFDKKVITSYESWQDTHRALVESLLSTVDDAIEKYHAKEKENKASPESKSSYNTFLKKQDPPKFSGDCLDFMEFKRKWLSQVTAHKPPAEYEMDLLKRSIPEEGRKKLYGVDSLSSAWNQLEKMYGDKSLICQKLKSRLKNLKTSSTEAHEIIIEINNEIEYLVKRLKDIDAVSLLYYDNEYLNVCYKHLPSLFQHQWDMFDTDEYLNSWQAFMEFMASNAKAALKKRTLVESLKDMNDDKKKGAKAVVGAVKTEEDRSSTATGELSEYQNQKYQELKTKAGSCKLCKTMHTFKSRWMSKPLPSDRFFSCQQFKNMSPKSRGETLQKFSACARCTSWSHKRSACQVQPVSCREQVRGAPCGKDHSNLVCLSGVPYCTSLAVSTGGADGVTINEDTSTIPYIQDLTVEYRGEQSDARAYWDGGSNRVLVNNEYAQENKMVPHPVTVVMKVAGGDQKRMNVNIYELSLVERDGTPQPVWGYGVDTIIEPDEPVDPSSLSKYFPHVPAEAFKQLEMRRVDILVGLNYNGLFPTGGNGRDCHEHLRVMRTRFGSTGWIIGGAHSSLNSTIPKLSAGATRIITAARLQVVPEVLIEESFAEVEQKFEEISVAKLTVESELTHAHWNTDNLGVLPARRCAKCRQCSEKGDCSEKHLIHTLEEENDLHAIEENVKIIDGVTVVRYPFKKDPSCLPYNRNTAVNIAGKLWNSLKRDGLIDAYNDEIKEILKNTKET